MAKQPKLYTRLTRPTSSVGSYNSLWLGPDHLMLVTSTGYTEEYRRLLLRDIQGIFTIETSRRSTWMIVWLVLAAIFGLTMLVGFTTGTGPYVSTPFFVVTVIALIWNQLLGAGCRVFVITGVQTLRLPSLVRRRKTVKVLRRVQPLIAAAQAGPIASDAPATAVAAEAPITPEPPALPEPPPLPEPPSLAAS